MIFIKNNYMDRIKNLLNNLEEKYNIEDSFKYIYLDKSKFTYSKYKVKNYIQFIKLFNELGYHIFIDKDDKLIKKLEKKKNKLKVFNIEDDNDLNKLKLELTKNLRTALSIPSDYKFIWGISNIKNICSIDTQKIAIMDKGYLSADNIIDVLKETQGGGHYYLHVNLQKLNLPKKLSGINFSKLSTLTLLFEEFLIFCKSKGIDLCLNDIHENDVFIDYEADEDDLVIGEDSLEKLLISFANLLVHYKGLIEQIPSNLRLKGYYIQ